MTPHNALGAEHPAAGRHALLAVLAVLALAAVAQWRVIVESGGFWLDEIFSASYVGLGVLDAVVAIERFDVHPPLYYLQLDAWGTLFGAGDTALLANALLWSLLGLVIGSLWLGRRHGALPALLFALLFAGSGAVLFYVAELRMYTLMMALTLLGLMASDRFRADGSERADAWRLAGVLIVLGAVHSAAAVVVSSCRRRCCMRCRGRSTPPTGGSVR